MLAGRHIMKNFINLSRIWVVMGLMVIVVPRVDANDRVNMPLEAFSIKAVKVECPPCIDGQLNDSCWRRATRLSYFTQFTPAQEAPATETTYCYIVYDDENLYFGAECRESDPSLITASVNNRDGILGDDWIMLMLDSYGDMRSAYEFIVNPFGIQTDAIQFGEYDDISWDAVWSAKGQITDDGWEVEMAIPFKAVRFSGKENQPWQFQIFRKTNHNGELSSYVPVRRIDNNVLARTAALIDLQGIRQPQSLSIMPCATGRLDRATDYTRDASLGADVKYTMQSNLVFDFTYNPDFGHVEADIDQINLTPYELSIIEKRPFFLEKMDIFKTLYTLFYSRRAINPQVGLKVTGKVRSYGLGALYVNDEDSAHVLPDTSYGVLRFTRDIFAQSRIGCLFITKENRGRYNRVFGIDGKILHGGFKIDAQLARSWTTDLNGPSYIGYGSIAYDRNDVFLKYAHNFAEADFRADAGFVLPVYIGWDLRPTSFRRDMGYGSYTWQINNTWLRRVTPFTQLAERTSYEHESVSREFKSGLTAEFAGNIAFSLTWNRNRTLWENQHFPEYSLDLSISANPSKYYTVYAFYGEGKALEYWRITDVWRRTVSFACELNPTTRIQITPSIDHVSQYESRDGMQILERWISVIRITYGLSNDTFLKAFLQHNSITDDYIANFLLGYTFLPGSTFYLAYNSGYRSIHDILGKQSEILFAKVSYLINL